jgi:hypothetical protein
MMTRTEHNAADMVAIQQGRRHKFVLYGELSDTSRKDWLVRGLLGAGEASAVYGKPGDGKSALVEDMALHIAAGREWHGRQVKQGAVLYVALERRELVVRRAIAFRERHGVLRLPFAVLGGLYDMRDPKTVQKLADAAHEVAEETGTDLRLLSIDTLSRGLSGGDENSPKDMGAIVNATSILQAATKAHILWVHHTPLDGADRLRGHGALLGAMDTTINVAKSGTIRTATVVKANDSEEGAQVAFTLESVVIGTDDEGNETTAPVVIPADANEARSPTPRKISDKDRLALEALATDQAWTYVASRVRLHAEPTKSDIFAICRDTLALFTPAPRPSKRGAALGARRASPVSPGVIFSTP